MGYETMNVHDFVRINGVNIPGIAQLSDGYYRKIGVVIEISTKDLYRDTPYLIEMLEDMGRDYSNEIRVNEKEVDQLEPTQELITTYMLKIMKR